MGPLKSFNVASGFHVPSALAMPARTVALCVCAPPGLTRSRFDFQSRQICAINADGVRHFAENRFKLRQFCRGFYVRYCIVSGFVETLNLGFARAFSPCIWFIAVFTLRRGPSHRPRGRLSDQYYLTGKFALIAIASGNYRNTLATASLRSTTPIHFFLILLGKIMLFRAGRPARPAAGEVTTPHFTEAKIRILF